MQYVAIAYELHIATLERHVHMEVGIGHYSLHLVERFQPRRSDSGHFGKRLRLHDGQADIPKCNQTTAPRGEYRYFAVTLAPLRDFAPSCIAKRAPQRDRKIRTTPNQLIPDRR